MKTYLRLLGTLRPYRGRFALALALMGLYGAANFVSIGMIALVMGALFERPHLVVTSAAISPNTAPTARSQSAQERRLAGPPSGLSAWPAPIRGPAERWLAGRSRLVVLEQICLVLLVVFLLKDLADYLQSYFMASIEQSVVRDLRGQMHRRLHDLPLSAYQDRRGGAWISRLTNDMEYVRTALASSISNLAKDALTLAGASFWLFNSSWRLTALSLLVVPPIGLTLSVVGRRMRKRTCRAQERMADMTAVIQENIGNARVVKAFGAEEFEALKFDRANRDYCRVTVRLRRVAAAAGPISEIAIVGVAVMVLWIGGREILVRQGLPPQSFLLFVGALLATLSPIRRMSEVNAGIQQGVVAGRRIFELIDSPPATVDRPGARIHPPLADRIRFENIGFCYRPGHPVLEDVSFEIARGETVALVGSSGAGKSTLLDLLARFCEPSSGRITIDGVDLRDGTVASLRAQLGIVTQDTLLFHDTVRANIAYGLPEAGEEAVRAASVAAHAHEFVHRLPRGYDTIVGERGLRLSGGERQRIAIARALLKDPPLLLLDEATSSLDAESERMVQEGLERLVRGRTALVIAHRLSTVCHAHRIVVLEQGRIVESGAHGELMKRDGVYRRLHGLQVVE